MIAKELAPAILEYNFSETLASDIVNQCLEIENWSRSTLVDEEEIQDIRTSSDINFESLNKKEEVLDVFNECVDHYNSEFQCGITQNETMTVLKYETGNYYVSHCDTNWQVYRVASALIYLNPTEYLGGETFFKLFDIKIKPKKPSIVIFPSNYAYEHEAMPVVSGKKFVIVTWMNDLPHGLDQETMKRVADG